MTGNTRPNPPRAPRARGLARGILRVGPDRAGAAALTFALTFPLFLSFVYAIVEFGRVMWTDHALSHVAAQATRYAIANPTASAADIQSYAESQLVAVDKDVATVTVTQETLDGNPYLTVKVAYPFQAMLPFGSLGSLALTGISRIRLVS